MFHSSTVASPAKLMISSDPTYFTTYYTHTDVNHGIITCTTSAICPDLLDYSKIGEADNMRGRVVRVFFWLMRVWPVRWSN